MWGRPLYWGSIYLGTPWWNATEINESPSGLASQILISLFFNFGDITTIRESKHSKYYFPFLF